MNSTNTFFFADVLQQKENPFLQRGVSPGGVPGLRGQRPRGHVLPYRRRDPPLDIAMGRTIEFDVSYVSLP